MKPHVTFIKHKSSDNQRIQKSSTEKEIQQILYEHTEESRQLWIDYQETVSNNCKDVTAYKLPRPFASTCVCKTKKINLKYFFDDLDKLEHVIDSDTAEFALIKTIKRIYQLNLFNRMTLLMMYSMMFPVLLEHEENELFDLFTVLPYLTSICKTKNVWSYIGPYEAQKVEDLVKETIRERIKSITNYIISYLEQCVDKGTEHYSAIRANSIYLQLQQIYYETKSILTRNYNLKVLNILNIWEIMWKNQKLTNASVIVLTIVALPSMDSHSEWEDRIHRAEYFFNLMNKIALKKKNRMHKQNFIQKSLTR